MAVMTDVVLAKERSDRLGDVGQALRLDGDEDVILWAQLRRVAFRAHAKGLRAALAAHSKALALDRFQLGAARNHRDLDGAG